MDAVIAMGAVALVTGLLVAVLVSRALQTRRFNALAEAQATPIAQLPAEGVVTIRGVVAAADDGVGRSAVDGRPVVYSRYELWYRQEHRTTETWTQDLLISDDSGTVTVCAADIGDVRGGYLEHKVTGADVPGWMIDLLAARGLHFETVPGTVTVREHLLVPGAAVAVEGQVDRSAGTVRLGGRVTIAALFAD